MPYELNQDKYRPDICIGTDENHTPKIIQETLYNFFKERGYKVELNKPFGGCIVPMKYYKADTRVMSVMIEINRKLYINRDIDKTEGYPRIKKDIADMMSTLKQIMI